MSELKRYASADISEFVVHSRYGYDDAGRLQSITHASAEIGMVDDNGTDTPEHWDGSGADLSTVAASEFLAGYFLTYDQANRLDTFSSRFDMFTADYAHELYEIRKVREFFELNDGVLTAGRLGEAINHGIPGNFHEQAIAFQDFVIERMRALARPDLWP